MKLVATVILSTTAVLLPSLGSASPLPKLDCLPVKVAKAQIGDLDDYTVRVGLEKDDYTGFIRRKKIKAKKKCLYPDVPPGKTVVLWANAKTFKKQVRSASRLDMQCIFRDSGDTLDEYGDLPTVGEMPGKDLLLKCGSKEKYPCDDGSNGERIDAYKKKMAKKGLMPVYFHVRPTDTMRSSEARSGKWNGRPVFCQAYHKGKKKILFATTFTVGPNE